MHQVIIIGSGFSGICLGIKLREAGVTDFKILEKASSLGGTWRENTYPGAECDIPSALYSFSFEHNPKWSFKWAGQKQILEYQQEVAEKYGLPDHFVFNQRVTKLSFDESKNYWTVETERGDTLKAQHVVSAVGQLHVPQTPKFDGTFEGPAFHSAEWDHSVSLTDKTVGVIGNAASALQFIPEIAKEAKLVKVFQRSPNWVLPKVDRPYAKWEQWLSERVPPITKLYRFSLWLRGEVAVYAAIKGNRFAQWVLRLWSQSYLKKHIKSAEMRAKLTPDYPVGAKRILFSDHYYEALARDNVALITDPITKLTAKGVETKQGADTHQTDIDVLIYGTGFVTNPFLSEIQVVGRDQMALSMHWQNGAHAYLGLATHGFPNLYFMYGPNTNLGHNSIILMIEAQAAAIVKLVKLPVVEVDKQAEDSFNVELQQRLNELAFSEVAASWYKVGERITNNWAGRTTEYRRRLNNINLETFRSKSKA